MSEKVSMNGEREREREAYRLERIIGGLIACEGDREVEVDLRNLHRHLRHGIGRMLHRHFELADDLVLGDVLSTVHDAVALREKVGFGIRKASHATEALRPEGILLMIVSERESVSERANERRAGLLLVVVVV